MMERSRPEFGGKEKGATSSIEESTHTRPQLASSLDANTTMEREATGTLGTDIEDESFSIYGSTDTLYGQTALHMDDSHSPYPDASLSSELLSGLKSSSRIDKFLWVRKLLLLALIFTISFSFVFFLFMSLPKVRDLKGGVVRVEDDLRKLIDRREAGEEVIIEGPELVLKFPKNMSELRVVRGTLEIYKKENQRQVQVGIVCLYLFLQTFMIPGSIFLNILAGSLYGFYEALFLVLVLATIGSALCYALSYFILKEIVYYYFQERCEWLAREVQRHRHNLLNYILFLRITPILPNWFVNVSAPLVSVPLREFMLGTFVGLIPASVVAVKAGSIMSQINSLTDLYDLQTILTISVIAFLVLVPVIIKSRLDQKRGPTLIKTI